MQQVSVRNHPTRDELFARREEQRKKAAELEAERLDVTQDGVNSDGEHSADEADESAEVKTELKEEEHVIKTEPPDTL
ncbi:unnamed protein product [Heligmosomoides polygyrus]|uniref:Uncharacterized protein n=1 Tax=Heligmosomoides polygyrus TaxID=6339 RepID=A0A3P7YWF9_HELPZ|nr:unnamed protein product [Heligmosomoides polygyrus]